MKALVVYESLWGNTAAIAKAIAEGIGEDAVAVSTAEATAEMVAEAKLIVAGAPLLGFALPNEQMRDSIRTGAQYENHPGDFSHPSMRSWIAGLPSVNARVAGFETRIWWSPGSAARAIVKLLAAKGGRDGITEKFLVTDKYGPLKDGEIERAKAWGTELARA